MPVVSRKARWILLAAVVVLAGVGAWMLAGPGAGRAGPSTNAIMVVAPYWYNGTWVFDDPSVGLRREPFVAGVPEMIDVLVRDVPDAGAGFRLLFSANPFPGHQKRLTWLRGDPVGGGNFYRMDDPPMEGWICPAMFKYYTSPPRNIYVKAEALRR